MKYTINRYKKSLGEVISSCSEDYKTALHVFYKQHSLRCDSK